MNRGQSDYAAANDALDKLLLRSTNASQGERSPLIGVPGAAQAWPAELETEYARRGIGLIDLNEGVEAFVNELHFGASSEGQVLLMCAGLNAMMGIDD